MFRSPDRQETVPAGNWYSIKVQAKRIGEGWLVSARMYDLWTKQVCHTGRASGPDYDAAKARAVQRVKAAHRRSCAVQEGWEETRGRAWDYHDAEPRYAEGVYEW